MRMPLARNVELVRRNAITSLLSTSSTPSSSIRKSGGVLDVPQETPDAVDSFVHPSNGGHWRLQLDVLGAAGAIALDVPRVDRRDRALNQSHVLLRHRLPPFLGNAFGGSTGLVDLGGRKACDQASHPDDDPSLALSKVTGAASRATVLNDHGKHNPIAEVADFLKPELQLLVRAKPVLKEAANGRPPLEVVPQRPSVEGRIFGEAAGHRVEITAIRSLKRPAHKLDQVGGRGLLGHHAAKYPGPLPSRLERASALQPSRRPLRMRLKRVGRDLADACLLGALRQSRAPRASVLQVVSMKKGRLSS